MCPFLSTVWVALWESLAELSYSRLLLPLLLSLFPSRRLFWRRTQRIRVREAWPRDTSSRTNILLPRSKKNATAITLSSRGRDRTLPSLLSLSLFFPPSFLSTMPTCFSSDRLARIKGDASAGCPLEYGQLRVSTFRERMDVDRSEIAPR